MSIIQTVIGSGAGSGVISPYPAPGNSYSETYWSDLTSQTSVTAPVTANNYNYYYEASALDNPRTGLWRKTYAGTLVGGGFDITPGLTEVQSLRDTKVGFGENLDAITIWSMSWFGYFKPAVSGDFVFNFHADDRMMVWIGQDAVGNPNNASTYLSTSVGGDGGGAIPMVADRYYPVRIYMSEDSGNHAAGIFFSLNGALPKAQQWNTAVGQFYYDTNAAGNNFPNISLLQTP